MKYKCMHKTHKIFKNWYLNQDCNLKSFVQALTIILASVFIIFQNQSKKSGLERRVEINIRR